MNRLYMTLLVVLALASNFAFSAIPNFNDTTRNFIRNNIALELDTNSVFAIDLDGDGDIDVVSANGTDDDTLAWFENDGSQNFTRKNIADDAIAAASVFAIDVDGDGDVDVLSANAGADHSIVWYVNDGNENFSRINISDTAFGAASVFAIDLDGDDDIDVLSATINDDTITWFENNDGLSFSRRNIAVDVAGAISVFAIDVDGDADIDVLTAGSTDNTITWFENNGLQNFSRNDIATDVINPRSVYAIDIDGDDDVDVFSASLDDDTVAWFENDGAESFTRNNIVTDADGASSVTASDMDNDGDLDILVASRFDNLVSWFENDGNQGFVRKISATATNARSVFAIDIDGDGDTDVVPANSLSSDLVWFENALIYSFSVEENSLDVGTTFATDALSYSLSGGDSSLFSVDSTGVITFNSAPNFEAPLDAGTDNVYNILVTAESNGDVASAEIVVTVLNVNDAPLISGSADITVAQDSAYSFIPTSSDPDGDELIFEIVNRPAWASFSRINGQLSGTPINFDVGVTEGIVISVRDGELTTALPAFNLTVTNVNDAPIILGNPTTTIAQNALYNFTPNSSDPDGDDLTFSIINKPDWASFTSSTGLLSGTPGNSDVGITEGIVISVSDATDTSSLPAFSLTVTDVNDVPVISGSPNSEVEQDTSYSFIPVASDIDGNELTFSIANIPSWASFSAETGELSGIPGNSDIGLTAGIVITVTDGILSSSLAAFSVRVTNVNDAPSISGSPSTVITQGSAYSFVPTSSDVDGDALIFDIVNRPSWAAFSRVNGALTGTPDDANVGVTEGIVISVRDEETTVSLPAFSVTVTDINDAPVAENISVNVAEDTGINIEAVFSDVDENDVLSVSIVDVPSKGTVNVSGNDFFYQPNENFNGIDTFSYVVSDGELVSENAIVIVNVQAENDQPIAVDDNFELDRNNEGIYTLDVLSNDVDIDGDLLAIDSADTEFGLLSIVSNELVLDLGTGFIGEITLAYIVRDGEGGRAPARVSLIIEGERDADSPLLTIPDDLTLFAKGRLSKLNFGIAKAIDPITSKALTVDLENSDNFLVPGTHNLVWSATSKTGLQSFATQKVNVIPQVSSSLNDIGSEGNSVSIEVSLNGKSPTYPLILPYTITGTAEAGSDHDAQSGELIITSGTKAVLDIQIFADLVEDDNESIIFSLSDSLNRAQNSETTITISEMNLPPKVSLIVEQNGVKRRVVAKDQGNVTISASVVDSNVNDTWSVTWSASDGEVSSSDSTDFLTIDPTTLTSSLLTISLVATDNGIPALSNSSEVIISVVESLAELTGADSDGDRKPDIIEGYSDDNSNGIPDYLDTIDDCNVIPQRVNEQELFLIEVEFGACIARGKLATQSLNGATELSETEVLEKLDADSLAKNIGGNFDFVIDGLQFPGQAIRIVLPQLLPIPSNAIYRKHQNDQWLTFVEDENNALYSAIGDRGVCPPPGDTAYTTGLTAGHWCVQLKIQDGGPNDMDNIINSAISDPGGVATTFLSNTLPIASNDKFRVTTNTSAVLNVLRNDEDADGDLLQIDFISVKFGQVSINSDNTLTYISPPDFVGEDVINYVITDNAGGSASAIVIIDAALNHGPVAVNDNETTDNETAVLINVIRNDTDLEGDQITVIAVSALLGTAEISGSDSVLYTPPAGFEGTDTLTYTIEEENGGTAEGNVTVIVTAPLPIPPPGPITAGTTSYIWLSLLMLIYLGRRVNFARYFRMERN